MRSENVRDQALAVDVHAFVRVRVWIDTKANICLKVYGYVLVCGNYSSRLQMRTSTGSHYRIPFMHPTAASFASLGCHWMSFVPRNWDSSGSSCPMNAHAQAHRPKRPLTPVTIPFAPYGDLHDSPHVGSVSEAKCHATPFWQVAACWVLWALWDFSLVPISPVPQWDFATTDSNIWIQLLSILPYTLPATGCCSTHFDLCRGWKQNA